jgi:uncharacterized protein
VSMRDQLTADMKESMKSGNKVKLEAVRMIISAIKYKETEDRSKPVDDQVIVSLLKTMVKQRKDSIDQFTQGGRQDLVDKETAELKIIESYLPQQMGRDQVEKLVAEAIASTGATSAKDMGKVMKEVMAKTGGNADGKMIQELVKAKLP